MPPRNPLQDLHVDDVRRGPSLADLCCYEAMSGPTTAPYRPPDCWCLESCTTTVCTNVPKKRKATAELDCAFAPEPPLQQYHPGDRTWVQHITVWHPGDFTCSRVEMDCNLPMRDIFRELCRDLCIERSQVQFVWRSTTRRHRALSDNEAPWNVGMREGHDECIECEYV